MRGYSGRLVWEDAPEHGIVGASERLSSGTVEVRCALPPASAMNLGRIHISFDGHANGLGLVLEVRSGSELVLSDTVLRVAGEGWIDIDAQVRPLPAKPHLVLVLRLLDPSRDTGLRIDLGPIIVR